MERLARHNLDVDAATVSRWRKRALIPSVPALWGVAQVYADGDVTRLANLIASDVGAHVEAWSDAQRMEEEYRRRWRGLSERQQQAVLSMMRAFSESDEAET